MNGKLDYFKNQFANNQNIVHLNNAGQSPLSSYAVETLHHWIEVFRSEGAYSYYKALPQLEDTRRQLAQFLGCQSGEVAFFQSAAVAISQIAFGLNLCAGDEIIIWGQEYPSNFYPWREVARRTGAKLIVVEPPDDMATPIELIEARIAARTRVIATSWVQFQSGAIIDLKQLSELARPRGIFTSVDVIQGVGCLPFHFQQMGIDAAACGSHKWLASGHGAGFLCLRSEHFERIQPLCLGALSFTGVGDKTTYSSTLEADAKRFEPGGKPFFEIFALGSTINLFTQTGMAQIHREAERLATQLVNGLRELKYEIKSPHRQGFRGAIVTFGPTSSSPIKSQKELIDKLQARKISHAPRIGGIRLSPHAFNSDADINLVLKLLS